MDDNITIGQKYGPAMKITSQDEANAYFLECVNHTMKVGKVSREEAERIERGNIGYYAGYYDSETRERMKRLFLAEHPIFDKATKY